MVTYDGRAQKERRMQSELVFFARERRELHQQFFLRVETREEVEVGQGRGVGGRVEGEDVSRSWGVGR